MVVVRRGRRKFHAEGAEEQRTQRDPRDEICNTISKYGDPSAFSAPLRPLREIFSQIPNPLLRG